MTSLVFSFCLVSCLLSLSFGAIVIHSSLMTAEQFVCTEKQAGGEGVNVIPDNFDA